MTIATHGVQNRSKKEQNCYNKDSIQTALSLLKKHVSERLHTCTSKDEYNAMMHCIHHAFLRCHQLQSHYKQLLIYIYMYAYTRVYLCSLGYICTLYRWVYDWDVLLWNDTSREWRVIHTNVSDYGQHWGREQIKC